MKIKFGALVVAGRGKVGGHVASRNRSGAYLRTKVTPVNPGTTYQTDARNRLGGLSSTWKGLTAAQRLAWNAAVVDYATTDIFGDLRNPSGFILHQKLNNNLLNIGKAAITVPPLSTAVVPLLTMSFAAINGGAATLTYTAPIEADQSLIVFATPALSPGKSFVKSEYRQIAVMVAADVTPYVITTEYEAKFGAIGASGQKIFIKAYNIHWDSGQAGIPLSAVAVIS